MVYNVLARNHPRYVAVCAGQHEMSLYFGKELVRVVECRYKGVYSISNSFHHGNEGPVAGEEPAQKEHGGNQRHQLQHSIAHQVPGPEFQNPQQRVATGNFLISYVWPTRVSLTI